MNLMEINDFRVKVEDKVILDGISLSFKEGEIYILFGPNGSGKTTLIHSIMGMPSYEIVSGSITFMGEDITRKDVNERASLGLSVGFQLPPEIRGIKLSQLLKLCLGKNLEDEFNDEETKMIEAFKLTEFLDRDLNVGFSGGERKRSEILQLLFLKPKLLLLDEPDSGIDVESLKLIGSEIQRYIKNTGSTALIVTHQGGILKYMEARYAAVLLEKNIHCFQDPKRIYGSLKEKGYKGCIECEEKKYRVAVAW